MRTSGVLMPISSLPSPYGIGTMGKSARKFVDFLVKGGQTYWQILPICPTSYGDSPYQSFSSFAGNPCAALFLITSLLNFMVSSMPVNNAIQPFVVSMASKESSLSSCMSLL